MKHFHKTTIRRILNRKSEREGISAKEVSGENGAMNTQKRMKLLLISVPVLLVLTIYWPGFAPILAGTLIYLVLLIFRGSVVTSLFVKRPDPPVYYRPTQRQQSQAPLSPHSTSLRPNFDLTAEEYEHPSREYQQGYQPQTQRPSKMHESAMPKQDRAIDYYEQPQAYYEQIPPIV